MSAIAETIRNRTGHLGPSEFAAALGLSKYQTPLDLYLEKTGAVERQPAGEAAYWGTVLEDLVAQEFARREGVKVRRRAAPVQHPFLGWMRGHVDRIITGTGEPLECKTAGAWVAGDWADGVPLYYLPQVYGYLLLLDAPRAHVAALIGGQQFRTYVVERDAGAEAAMLEQLLAFWRCVERGTPPAAVNAEDLLKLYPADVGSTKVATHGVAAAYDDLRAIKAQIKGLEKEAAECEQAIKGAMADAALLTDGAGRKLATWKTQSSRRLDQKALADAHPELVEQFKTVSKTRVFRTY